MPVTVHKTRGTPSEEVEHLCLLTDRLYDLLVDISYLDAKWEKQALDLPAQKAA